MSDPGLPRIDVINMSYGEHSHWSNTGRIGDLMHEVTSTSLTLMAATATFPRIF
jgi:tripeptidyl-peptidase-2